MEVTSSVDRRELLKIAALVSFRIGRVYLSGSVQGLMEVADVMDDESEGK